MKRPVKKPRCPPKHKGHGEKHALHRIELALAKLNRKLEKIMASQSELAADLKAVTAKVAKIGTETAKTLQKVIDLEALLAAAGNTSPEVDDALAELKAQAQATDDLTPDAP